VLKVVRYIGSSSNPRMLSVSLPKVTPYAVRGVGKAVLPKINPLDVFRSGGATKVTFGRALPILGRQVVRPLNWIPVARLINLALLGYEFYELLQEGTGVPDYGAWDGGAFPWDLPGWVHDTSPIPPPWFTPDTRPEINFGREDYGPYAGDVIDYAGQAENWLPPWSDPSHILTVARGVRGLASGTVPTENDVWLPESWVRPLGAPDPVWIGPMTGSPPLEVPQYFPPLWRMPNPNWERYDQPDKSEPIPKEVEVLDVLSVGSAVEITPGQMLSARRATERAPQRNGDKDKKVISRTASLGHAIFKALDKISEAAEVVDAVYDALPKDVKKRWEKDRGAHWAKVDGKFKWVGLNRGPVDTFGQYGIDGADWKLQAIYHNWHKIDAAQAVRNIVKNELADQIVGRYHKHAPKNSGVAMEEQEKFLNKKVDDALSFLGL